MKKLLIASILLLPFFSFAQNVELAVGVGVSTNTQPSSNMAYKFDKMTINYAGNISILYNFADNVQAGVEGTMLELSGISDKIYTGPGGTPIGGDNKRFVYAKAATAICAVFNGRLNVGNGYVYAGVAAGYGIARDNSKTLGGNEAYRAPDGGNGIALGAQVGYIKGITSKLGIFAEGALRYYDLKYDAEAPDVHPHANLHYHIIAFPLTIGLRYRLINMRVQNDIPAFRGRGRSR